MPAFARVSLWLRTWPNKREVYLGLERFDEGEVFLMRHLEHLYESGKEPNERLLEIMAEYETR